MTKVEEAAREAAADERPAEGEAGGNVAVAEAGDAAPAGDASPEEAPAPSPFGEVSAATRKCMQGNKRRDTSPELKVRRMLRDLGFPGYRLDWKKAPGHPDIAYPGRKIAIFVHGCYWHHCPVCNLPVPKKNPEYWEAKFRRNQERDERTRATLEADGWKVAVIWEHQLKKAALADTERYLYEIVRWDDDGDDVPAEDPRTAAESARRAAGPTDEPEGADA